MIKKTFCSVLLIITAVGINAQSTPTANFTADTKTGNSPLTVQFTNISEGNPSSWAWDFNNDGTTDANEQNPSYTYSTSGIFTVKLTVANNNGSNTKIKDDLIIVLPKITQCTFETNPTIVNNFDSHNSANWLFATWSFGGNATMFKAENGVFDTGKLNLTLKSESYNGKNYTGGHYQSNSVYGYGKYEITMKAANAGGLVSSFFLFSDADFNNQKWSEIDFEFIYDPTNQNKPTLQFNHWNKNTNGAASGNETRIVDNRINSNGLRDSYHKLTIEYTPNYIKWLVDDIPYHIANQDIPISTSLKIMMNIWRPEDITNGVSGDGINWAGNVNDNDLPITASYDCFKHYPLVDCNNLSTKTLSTNNDKIKIHPNPSNEFLFIEWHKKETAQIYNLQGQKLTTILLKQGENKINISKLQTGVYFLKIRNQNTKFVKN